MIEKKYLKWILLANLLSISVTAAILPPAELGTVPFDHDKFLQFPESNRADTTASGQAYYQTVDPNNLRTTLSDWKTLNGFNEPLPSDTAGLAAMGITHALYRNATDLGFVRNIYMRVKPNGDVVALLENYPGFVRTTNFSFDDTNDGCNVAFNPAFAKELRCTSGGIDAFENRDLSGMLASVVMEYSAVTPGGPKFTQFYGYGNDGSRVSVLDLTGRGKAEAFPGLCAVCHGGNPASVDENGEFVPPDLAYKGAKDGNFGAGFLPFDPDLYEYHDPDGTGVDVGSGIYKRANQEDLFKELNRLVLDTNPTKAAREIVEGWYGGAGLPNGFDGLYVPPGWTETTTDSTFYKTVLAPYCRACHIQRAFPESETNLNAQESIMDFNQRTDLYDLDKPLGKTVFTRTTMPLALVTYNKFWDDTTAVTNFLNYIEEDVIETTVDSSFNLTAVMPGKPIANPGTYIDHIVGKAVLLDGTGSMSADTYSWSVSPSSGVTLINTNTATPTMTANTAGIYTLTLAVSNNEKTDSAGRTRPADTSVPISTTIKFEASPFLRVTFDSTLKNSPTNARCLKCHSPPYTAGSEDFNFFSEMLKMSELERYSIVEGNFTSRLLYKSAGLLGDYRIDDGIHSGGKILTKSDAYYSVLKNWIEDGECQSNGENNCQRISVTNENTTLEIDPLSPFMNKSLTIALTGINPAHGTLSLTSDNQLKYQPAQDFSGLDSYKYLLIDPETGLTGLVTDRVYVFPELGITTAHLSKTFSSQFLNSVPKIDSIFDFEKVNTDGDVLPNYLDDFPNNPLISRDNDNDGIPDAFNTNVSTEVATSSGINIDLDDDNDGISDINDALPFDALGSTFNDSDKDGIDDALDPFSNDMTGTIFEDFETGDLSTIPWVTSGNRSWSIIAQSNVPPHNPLVGNYVAKTPLLGNNESASLSVTLNVASGYMSYWYFLSSESSERSDSLTCDPCYFDQLIFTIDGSATKLAQTNDWVRVSFPVSAGTHTFTWTYIKDGSVTSGLDAGWIDYIEFSGSQDSDSDGASDVLDNCPDISNSDQNDINNDGTGDACDMGDSDGDGISDANEIAQGLNIAVKDTDSDGINDNVDDFPLDPAASLDTDGDGYPDVLVLNVNSVSQPPLTVDLEPFNPRAGIDFDGDGVGDNIIYTIAGTGEFGYTGDGGLATKAQISGIGGLAVDSAGNLFLSDSDNQRIRRIDAITGVITTISGTGNSGFSGDGNQALLATFSSPGGLLFDVTDNLFIVDRFNGRIRKIDKNTGIITTVAGSNRATVFNGDGGLATDAKLNKPNDLAFDPAGNLIITEDASAVRKVDTATGIITTIVGGDHGFGGDGGLSSAAQLGNPSGVAYDASGNLFIADREYNVIRRVDVDTGIISTIAGTKISGNRGDDSLAILAELNQPMGIKFDSNDNLYIADSDSDRVRRIDAATNIITTYAGTGRYGYNGEARLAKTAHLYSPEVLAFDNNNNLFIPDVWNSRIRQVNMANPSDAFPFDPAASVDSDGDGFPDSFNVNATTEQIAASGLVIDAFPNDPSAAVDADNDGVPDYSILGGALTSLLPLDGAGELKPTYDGSSGMQATVLNTCINCHTSGGDAPDLTTLSNAQNASERIKIRVNDGTMPVDGALNATQQSLAAAWHDIALTDNAAPYQYFAPYIEQNPSTFKSLNIGSNFVDIQAAVNDNGANTTYIILYGIGNYDQTKVANSSSSLTGGGGLIPDDMATATLTGLICNTNYQYKITAFNVSGTTSTTVFKNFTTTNLTNDCDADGLPDSWENTYGFNSTDPSDASLDTDNDGLTNYEEFFNSTDPNDSDTDNDGMNDGYEVNHGFNPLDSSDCPSWMCRSSKVWLYKHIQSP